MREREPRPRARPPKPERPPVPPVVARDGTMVRLVAGKPAVLFPWVDGDMLCLRGVTPAAGREVGGALARMHLAGPPPDGSLVAGRFGPAELVARCDRVADVVALLSEQDAREDVLAGAQNDASEA